MKWMIGAAIAVLAAAASNAQAPGFTRTLVQEQDLGTVPGRQAVVARVELVPGGAVGKHTHAGEGFFVPAGVVHEGKNTGSGKAVVLATYVHEKGKPVATPVK